MSSGKTIFYWKEAKDILASLIDRTALDCMITPAWTLPEEGVTEENITLQNQRIAMINEGIRMMATHLKARLQEDETDEAS